MPMRAAIIGTGGIAHTHARTLGLLGHEIALVVGRRAESARAFGEQYGCKAYAGCLTEELLAGVDAVHICTPPGNHFPWAARAIRAGKAVFCEKPLTFSVEEAEELCRMAEEAGTAAAVDFNNRFYPACGRIRRQLADSGPVELIHGHYRQEFEMMPAPWSWRYTAPMRAVTEIGSHFVDLMRFLSGLEAEAVSAVFRTVSPERRLREGRMYPGGEGEAVTVSNEDAAAVTIKLRGGAVASVFLSEISPGRGNDLAIELMTREETLGWHSEDPYCVLSGRKGQGISRLCDPFGGGFSTTFLDTMAAFYAWAEGGARDSRLATFRDGLAAVRLCSAMACSAEKGGAFIPVP